MLSIIIININSPPLCWQPEDGKWTEKKNLWPFEWRENWKKFCMFYVPLQSLACHKNLLFVVFLTLDSILCTSFSHLWILLLFSLGTTTFMLFLWAFCFWFCVGSTFYYTRPFFCVKKVTIVKKWRKIFPRKVNKAIEEAELCASWLISFEEIQREREKDTQTRDIKSGGNLWMSWGITR